MKRKLEIALSTASVTPTTRPQVREPLERPGQDHHRGREHDEPHRPAAYLALLAGRRVPRRHLLTHRPIPPPGCFARSPRNGNPHTRPGGWPSPKEGEIWTRGGTSSTMGGGSGPPSRPLPRGWRWFASWVALCRVDGGALQ